MFKKALVIVSILMLFLTAACSGQAASASGSTTGISALSQVVDSSKLSVQDKLGVGILSLEGTDLSITSDQAALLLPLWQAVQSLGSDKNAASAEIAALYTQIQGTLTPEQLAQIEQLTWTQDELASLLQQHQAQTTLASSTTSSSTTSASSSSQSQNMGGGPGGDMMPPDAALMLGGGADLGMTTGQSTTTTTQQSLIASQASANNKVDLNVLFANAVINLLQQQVNA
jgi:hypothetical protein